ncbi:hypothetical protein [Streptomyces sp. NPDC001985]|uniref:hypothetical protein n=1 Tax=Streptomyces sp. NPDC001985 TaxID=3154406 RepID=UPI00331DA11A
MPWNRQFQLWRHSVGHAVLLLRRSHDPDRYGTRIDVLFPAVALMRLRPSYASLRIDAATAREHDALLGGPAPDIAQGALRITFQRMARRKPAVRRASLAAADLTG